MNFNKMCNLYDFVLYINSIQYISDMKTAFWPELTQKTSQEWNREP